MQRLLISLSSLVAFAASAQAQTAPDAQPPTTQPADPAAAPPPAEAPPVALPPPPPPKAEDPKRLSVGKETPGSWFTPGLNLQGWFVYDETAKVVAAGAPDVSLSTSTFRVRRAEISGGGAIIPKFVTWRFMFDPARVRDTFTTTNAANATTGGAAVPVRTYATAISTLQDAYITVQGEFMDVTIGQFKAPISWDAYGSAAKIIMPDRQFIALLEGGVRDIGVRLEKTFEKFSYVVGVVNGSGQNNFDTNNQKDVMGRVEIYPVPGMTIAGAFYDSVGYRSKAGTKDRWEGDFRYETGPFLIQSEFIRNRDILADNGPALNSQGGYVALAYKLKGLGSGNWKGDLQPVVRVGYFDPNTDANVVPGATGADVVPFFPGVTDERFDYEFGLNYYLRGHEMKFQASYDRQQFDNSAVKPAVNEVIVATQVWF
jgi:hypothetical protein